MNGSIAYEKFYVDKVLVGFTSPYKDPFQYRSMDELGSSTFERVLDRILSEIISRDLSGKTGKEELSRLVGIASMEFHPKHWYIAFLNDDPVGLILPQKFPDSLKEGTLYLIGIIPEFRRKGFSKILHAKGLETLSLMGVERYVGSTDVNNSTMMKVFLTNGCNYIGIRQLDEVGSHLGWRERPKK